MNILIISGGSGNDSLVKGLKSFYPEANIKVLVNAYDAGKSTGVCREITNTLGVSDIRKNHIRMYKATCDNINQCIVEFYENRYDFTKGYEVQEICDKLDQWNLDFLSKYVVKFFNRECSKHYDFVDFCVSNIVYAEMYAEHGYEVTNKYFCDLLGIDDFVILNSFDNVYVKAQTESGYVIHEEGELVEYCNPDDIIVKMIYDVRGETCGLNPLAIDAINKADLIIVSTGTFWSSIYPTLEYNNLYKYLNDTTAKKVWAINCEPDKDCYGVGSNQMIKFVSDLGLDLSQFTILENSDANELLRQKNKHQNIVYFPMENNNGKHNGIKYARAILRCFYGLTNMNHYSHIIFDFDDTLWARSAETCAELMQASRNNIELVSKLGSNASIISGNSFDSIYRKLTTIYGADISKFNVPIWADANATEFVGGVKRDTIPELVIRGNYKLLLEYLHDTYGITATLNDEKSPTCIKIKPLSAVDQLLVSNYLNDYLLSRFFLTTCKAIPTGRTTVDIVTSNNVKRAVLDHISVDKKNILYIGDEVDNGNDKEISDACGFSIHTSGVQETNALLRLLIEDYE